MKRLLLILTFLIFPWAVFATGQGGDILIWKGDTLTLLATPLEMKPGLKSLRHDLFAGQKAGITTACWRGYIAEWTLEGKELYLTNIYSCTYSEDSIKANLQNLFPSEYKNGRINASWVTGNFIVPLGKLIHYNRSGFEYFYEKEIEISFADGRILNHKTHDNSKSHKSIYTERSSELHNFIYGNIDWDLVPETGEERMVAVVSIQSGALPRPDSVQLLKGTKNNILDKEILRVVNSLPDWDVYYRKGKPHPVKWTLPIRFDAEIRKKYAR